MGFFGFLGEVISEACATKEELDRREIKKKVIECLEKGSKAGIICLACTKTTISDYDPEEYKAHKRRVSDVTIKILRERQEFELLEEIEKQIELRTRF